MDETLEQLIDYIRQYLDMGVPAANIRHALMQHDWEPGFVDYAFQYVDAQANQRVSDPSGNQRQPEPARAVQKAFLWKMRKLYRMLAKIFRV